MNAIEDYDSYSTLFQAVSIVDETQEPTTEMLKALSVAAENNDEAFSNLIDFTSRFESSYEITVLHFLPIKNKNEKLIASFYAQIIEKGNNRHTKKKRNASFHRDDIEIEQPLVNFNQKFTYNRPFRNSCVHRSHSRTNSSIPIITSFEIENEDENDKSSDVSSFSSSSSHFISELNVHQPKYSFGSLSRNSSSFVSKSSSNFYSNIDENLLKFDEFYKAAAVLVDSPLYTNCICDFLTSKMADPVKIQESGICEVITRNVINETNEIEFLTLMFNLSCKSFFKPFIVAIPKLFSNMRNSKDKEVVRLSFICLAVIAKSYTDEFDFYVLLKHAAKAVNTTARFAQSASSFIFQNFISKAVDQQFIQEIADIFIESYSEPSKPASTVAKVIVDFVNGNESRKIRDESMIKLKEIAAFC